VQKNVIEIVFEIVIKIVIEIVIACSTVQKIVIEKILIFSRRHLLTMTSHFECFAWQTKMDVDDEDVYTVNHKKRDILFFSITLANLNRFV